MRVLVTGVAGFIGSNVARALLALGEDVHVVGIDNMDPYYDVSLKSNRLAPLTQDPRFVFIEGDIADKSFVDAVFDEHAPEYVLNFAAKVGVTARVRSVRWASCRRCFLRMKEATRHT